MHEAPVSISEAKPNHGRFQLPPGPGRPAGRKNNITVQQRAVAEMVLGKPGTPEFDEFVLSQRKQALAGILPPGILQLWMFYLLGKPIERVEVKDTTQDFEGVTAEQLRERATIVAQRVVEETMPQGDEAAVH
jgi:hypothetical protein